MEKDEVLEVLRTVGLEGEQTELAEKLTEIFNKSTEGLLSKRTEILTEKKGLEEKYNEMKKKLESIDMSEYNSLLAAKEKAELIGKGSPEDVADLQLAIKRLETEKQSIAEALSLEKESKVSIEKKMKSDKVKLGLTEAFNKVGVIPTAVETLISAYSGRAEVQVKEDGNIDILVKSNDGGILPLNTWIDSWATNPDNKLFIKAKNVIGSGASGSGNPGGMSKKDMTLDQAEAYKNKYGVEAFKALS